MPAMLMTHEVDPRKKILAEIGSVDDFEIFNNQVLAAVYVRPTKTKSGIYIPDKTADEDQFQGKVGLVLKTGPAAFDDPENKWFSGVNVKIHDWIVFRPSDGWKITVNNVLCRIFDDTDIRGRVDHPDRVW